VKEPLERLTDLEPTAGSTEAEGIALLRARQRHRPPMAQKARVRAALESRAGAVATWRRRPAVVAVIFAAILLVGQAASSTSFGRGWVGAHYRRLLAWVSPQATPAPAPVARPGSLVTPAIAQVPAEALTVPAAPPHPARAPASHAEALPPRHVTAPVINAAITDEPTLVATAMRALRRDHDPAGAGRLLDDYLRRWPDGALIEEALALAIEAANARGDARARTFATAYLQRFPSGRFGEAARRTLAHAAP
jgi:hypothetical protein